MIDGTVGPLIMDEPESLERNDSMERLPQSANIEDYSRLSILEEWQKDFLGGLTAIIAIAPPVLLVFNATTAGIACLAFVLFCMMLVGGYSLVRYHRIKWMQKYFHMRPRELLSASHAYCFYINYDKLSYHVAVQLTAKQLAPLLIATPDLFTFYEDRNNAASPIQRIVNDAEIQQICSYFAAVRSKSPDIGFVDGIDLLEELKCDRLIWIYPPDNEKEQAEFNRLLNVFVLYKLKLQAASTNATLYRNSVTSGLAFIKISRQTLDQIEEHTKDVINDKLNSISDIVDRLLET